MFVSSRCKAFGEWLCTHKVEDEACKICQTVQNDNFPSSGGNYSVFEPRFETAYQVCVCHGKV